MGDETLTYRHNVDLALTVANVIGYGAQNNYRIQWKTAMSNEVLMVCSRSTNSSFCFNYTTHLHDVTMVKTAVNAYHHALILLNPLRLSRRKSSL